MSRASGSVAEDQAARHLSARGYRILHRNYTVRAGEVDLVASAPDGTLCFVEVRARGREDFGRPAETISRAKRRRIVTAARHYLAREVRGAEPNCRFDVIELDATDGRAKLTYIPDAFRLDDV